MPLTFNTFAPKMSRTLPDTRLRPISPNILKGQDHFIRFGQKADATQLLQDFQKVQPDSPQAQLLFERLYEALNPKFIDILAKKSRYDQTYVDDALQTVWMEGLVTRFAKCPPQRDFQDWFLHQVGKVMVGEYFRQQQTRLVSSLNALTDSSDEQDFFGRHKVHIIQGSSGIGGEISKSNWARLKPLLDQFKKRYPDFHMVQIWLQHTLEGKDYFTISKSFKNIHHQHIQALSEEFNAYLRRGLSNSHFIDFKTQQSSECSDGIANKEEILADYGYPLAGLDKDELTDYRGQFLTALLGNELWRYSPHLLTQNTQNLQDTADALTKLLGHERWKGQPQLLSNNIETLKAKASILTKIIGSKEAWCKNYYKLLMHDPDSLVETAYLLNWLGFRLGDNISVRALCSSPEYLQEMADRIRTEYLGHTNDLFLPKNTVEAAALMADGKVNHDEVDELRKFFAQHKALLYHGREYLKKWIAKRTTNEHRKRFQIALLGPEQAKKAQFLLGRQSPYTLYKKAQSLTRLTGNEKWRKHPELLRHNTEALQDKAKALTRLTGSLDGWNNYPKLLSYNLENLKKTAYIFHWFGIQPGRDINAFTLKTAQSSMQAVVNRVRGDMGYTGNWQLPTSKTEEAALIRGQAFHSGELEALREFFSQNKSLLYMGPAHERKWFQKHHVPSIL